MAEGQHGQHRRGGPAEGRTFDECEGDSAERQRGQKGADDVDVTGGAGVARFGNVAGGDQEHERTDGQVDQEDQPPRCGSDQVAAEQGAGRGGHAAEPRPRSDGLAAVIGIEGRLEDGQASGGQECSPDTLEHPGTDQDGGPGGEGTGGRGEHEPDDTHHEHPSSPEIVSERSPQEEEGRQREGVAGHHPLQRSERRMEFAPDGRKGDTDNGGVDGRHGRTEHRGRDDPSAPLGPDMQEPGSRIAHRGSRPGDSGRPPGHGRLNGRLRPIRGPTAVAVREPDGAGEPR